MSYAYLALGNCCLSAAHAKRERAAVGKVVFVTRDGGYASFGRPAYSSFVERAARTAAIECDSARLRTVYHDGPGRGPRDRAGARSHGNAEKPHPLVETYLQDLKFDRELGPAPVQDHYFLGRMDLGESVDRRDYLSKEQQLCRRA